MKLVITGFMGCGKSRIARELAKRLNLQMIDLDDRIRQREGRSAAQLINEEGEASFRSIETDVLHGLMATNEDCVIALGGGAWIVERNRALIEQHNFTSIWLDAPFELCWSRIEASDAERPLGKTRDEAQARYDRRRPIYQLAKIHIEVREGEDLEDRLARISHRLHR